MTKEVTLYLKDVPRNAWESYLSHFIKADKAIRQLLGNAEMGQWLDTVIHNMIWHEGDCVVRWVNENPDLVRKLNSITEIEEYKSLQSELDISVLSLNRLDNK